MLDSRWVMWYSKNMKKELKNKFELEYPDIPFHVAGIDSIPLYIAKRFNYAVAITSNPIEIFDKLEKNIYILSDVNQIAHNAEELETVFYHEVGHLMHGISNPRDIAVEEYQADDYAATHIGWRPLVAVLEHIIENHPNNQTAKDRLARANNAICNYGANINLAV